MFVMVAVQMQWWDSRLHPRAAFHLDVVAGCSATLYADSFDTSHPISFVLGVRPDFIDGPTYAALTRSSSHPGLRFEAPTQNGCVVHKSASSPQSRYTHYLPVFHWYPSAGIYSAFESRVVYLPLQLTVYPFITL